MKIGSISGDMAVKLGIGLVVVVGAVYLVRKAAAKLTEAGNFVAEEVVPLVNPADSRNVAYHTVNTVGAAIVTSPDGPGKNADGSWTFGGFLYDINPFTDKYKG